MRRIFTLGIPAVLCLSLSFYFLKKSPQALHETLTPVMEVKENEEEDLDGYDGAAARDQFEFEKIKDPALGYVPAGRLLNAIEYTAARQHSSFRTMAPLTWTERGPIFDLVGPSGNSRGPGTNYTSGRIAGILIDTLNDPSGNTVFVGGIAGGLWKCTNFLTAPANWQKIDDKFDNLAISSIAQDPSNPAIMYFSTGEATANADAVNGVGLWKSTDAGVSWTRLPSTANYIRTFKVACDAAGNVYLAERTTTASLNVPVTQTAGLLRSTDGGTSWVNITPTGITGSCTDIEISTTGRFHASFGYSTATTRVVHAYTDAPASVTSGTWSFGVGLRTATPLVGAGRLELATNGNLVYGVTTNGSGYVDSIYKSIDGGLTWTKQNAAAPSTGGTTLGVTNTQGWYDLTLAINPNDTSQIWVGGLDAFQFTGSGRNAASRKTFWASGTPYVHADHHFMQWWNIGGQSRMVIGCDGGIFLSTDGGATFSDRNRNLAIKQFYGAWLHPDAGSNYMLAGAQDNGVHALNGAGLTSSTEVYGGDGFFTHINQQNPQIQFGTYVGNVYRRSLNGGTSWSSFTISSNGLFVNPFDYDDGQNILYASDGNSGAPNNQIVRWSNAATGSGTVSTFVLSGLIRGSNSNASAFKVSPYTKNRVYIGGSTGKLLRLDNANTVTSANVNANVTDITGSSFPGGFLNCVNVGSSDNYLVAVFSNFGVNNVWYSSNGGTSWTAIDGTGAGALPDMPVRWAIFDPQHDDRLILATEAGIYTTNQVNGSSTVWNAESGFPNVRTDMLQLRLSDNTIVAATHGRGLFTAVLPGDPEIRFSAPFATVQEGTSASIGCRGYRDYTVNVSSVFAPTGDATVTYNVTSGTAVEGRDFDFTTNGDFTTPSHQQVFQDGVGGSKTVTIRVYDDAAVEGTENFKISFSISGTTNAVAGSANTYEVTIQDNDFAPVPHKNAAPYAFGADTVTSLIASPFRSDSIKHRIQIMYRASELAAMGLTSKGNLYGMSLNVKTKNSTRPFTNFRISVGQTTSTSLSTGFNGASLTQVYLANYSTTAGVNQFTFGTGAGSASSFAWDGTSNIVIQFCFDNVSGPADAAGDIVAGYNPFGAGSASTNYPTTFSNSSTGSGCSLSAAFITNTRPDAVLTMDVTGNAAATVLNTTSTNYMAGGENIFYYDATGKILANITNMGGHDYGCTQVTIDRAGTGALPFWDNNPANYVTEKTWHIVPASNDNSSSYLLTLYFTAAEKAGWEAVTGQSWSSIKVIKVASQISNYSPTNQAPDGSFGAQVITPIFGMLGDDYTLTITASGFSGFAAGNPAFNPLPVNLLSFTGRLEGNTGLLEWSTSSENNSRSFDIEKSTDGVSYTKIGSVQASGNSTVRRDYSFRDLRLSPVNHYRLRMVDMDGRTKLSSVVILRVNDAKQNLWVVNNPFHGYLDLRLAKEAQKLSLQLISATGSVVAEKSFARPADQLRWQLPAGLAQGSYVVRAVVDGKLFTSKVVKQ